MNKEFIFVILVCTECLLIQQEPIELKENRISVVICLCAASIRLLQGTGVSALMIPASHKNILDPDNNKQSVLRQAWSNKCGCKAETFFFFSVLLRFIFISYSLPYLGGHIVGVMNHHRTGEVFVEVVYIFTHSGTKWNKNKLVLIVMC